MKQLLILLLLTASLSAQELSWGGYLKDMLSWTNGRIEGVPSAVGDWQNTLQARLNINFYWQNSTLTVQSRHLLESRKNYRDMRNLLALYEADNGFTDFSTSHYFSDSHYYRGEIDRIYLDWSAGNWQVTAGKQRIAWGSALVWNVTDFFNPFNILDFDYEEKPGSDALRVQYYTGPTSQLDIAISPTDNRRKHMLAARWLLNVHNYDINILAAWQKEKQRYGLNWAGAIAGAGFRGEAVYTKPNLYYNPYFASGDERMAAIVYKWDTAYWNLVLSLDYTFANSLYLHGEYLYNEAGSRKNAAQREFIILQTGELSAAKNNLFLELAYDITPLLRGDYFILANPDDRSVLHVPSLQYSLSDNWELYALAFISRGSTLSSYGSYPAQYFLRLKVSF